MIQAQQIAPDVSVFISDGLRALVKGSAGRAAMRDRDNASRPVVATPVDPTAHGARQLDGWQDMVVRCDGRRPLRFAGHLLLSMTDDTPGGGAVQIDLYASSNGAVHVHVTLTPARAAAAPDVRRGASFSDTVPVMDFLMDCAPRLSLRPMPAAHPQGRHDQQTAAAALQGSYNILIAAMRPHIRSNPQRSTTCP